MQPAAIIMLEQVAHNDAASLLVSVEPNELCSFIGSAKRALSELPADVIRLLVVRALDRVPHLLLASMMIRHGEGGELLQRHAVFGVDLQELFGDGGETKALFHDRRRYEEPRSDFLLAETFFPQGVEGAELI